MYKFIILLFYLNVINSQTYQCLYEFEILYTEEQQNNQKLGEQRKKDMLNAKKVSPVLEFNNDYSVFYCDKMKNIDFNMEMIYTYANCFANTYQKNNLLYKNNKGIIDIPDYKYMIKCSMNYHWELTNNSKMINGYKCYEAKGKRINYITETESVTVNIVAWYCPEIPVNYGPGDYGNLPGLIFFVQEFQKIFRLKEIKKIDKMNFGFDIKGEEITEKDFDKKLMEFEAEILKN